MLWYRENDWSNVWLPLWDRPFALFLSRQLIQKLVLLPFFFRDNLFKNLCAAYCIQVCTGLIPRPRLPQRCITYLATHKPCIQVCTDMIPRPSLPQRCITYLATHKPTCLAALKTDPQSFSIIFPKKIKYVWLSAAFRTVSGHLFPVLS